jgi:transposase
VEMTAGSSEASVLWSLVLSLQKEVALADVEIIARVERRRKWTAQEKAALLAEVEAEGGKVTIVARRHRMSESVLYNWRAAWKAAAAVMQAPVAAPFIPLGVLGGSSHRDAAMLAQPEPGPPEPETARPMRASDGSVGGIEIVLPNGARVSVDAFVDEKALSRVLRAMKGST